MEAAAFALAVADVSLKLAGRIGKFVNQTRDAPGAIAEFRKSVLTLQAALEQVARVFKQCPHPLVFEARHHHDVFQILKSCGRSLNQLTEKLPQLNEDVGILNSARAALELSLRSEGIQNILSNIDSYTQVLQLSLSTIQLLTVLNEALLTEGLPSNSRRSLWETQRSQVEIQAEIRKLTDTIRSTKPVAQALNCRTAQWRGGEADDAATENLTPMFEIQAWESSADYVAAAVSLHEFDPKVALTAYSDLTPSLSRKPSRKRPALESLNEEEDKFEPEPGRLDCPSEEILGYQFEANQSIVKTLFACGIFGQASLFQRKGIEIREDLNRVYQAPFPFEDQTAMREFLAEIHLSAQTKEGMQEAKSILQDLLFKGLKLPAGEKNLESISSHYHKLGELMIQLGDLGQAIKFLGRALEGREALVPRPFEDVIQTTNQLVKALQLDEQFDKAHGYKEWLQHKIEPLKPESPPQPSINVSKLALVYEWCKSHEFDVNSPTFSLEALDIRMQMTPLHKAVQEMNVEILKVMMDSDVRINGVEDVDLPAPILLAASTKDKATLSVLLDKGAEVDVRDKSGMTPLHRCQTRSGGLEVAELLLDRSPSILDVIDKAGKTALFMATEMGNVQMVQFLLDRAADPNICHQPQAYQSIGSLCTPLIAAIQVVRTQNVHKIVMVKDLLSHGADPKIKDLDGNNAFFFATHAGLASREIKSLMQTYAASSNRRPSAASQATTFSQSSGHTAITTATTITRFSWISRRRSEAKADGR